MDEMPYVSASPISLKLLRKASLSQRDRQTGKELYTCMDEVSFVASSPTCSAERNCIACLSVERAMNQRWPGVA